jgi:peroxiredoxin
MERSMFVIDGKGKPAHIFCKVKPETHVDEVLEAPRFSVQAVFQAHQ